MRLTPSSCWDRDHYGGNSQFYRLDPSNCKTDSRGKKINICSSQGCTQQTDGDVAGVLMRVDARGGTAAQRSNFSYQWQVSSCSYNITDERECRPSSSTFYGVPSMGDQNTYKAQCSTGETANYKYRLKVTNNHNGQTEFFNFDIGCYSCMACPNYGSGGSAGTSCYGQYNCNQETSGGDENEQGQCASLCTGGAPNSAGGSSSGGGSSAGGGGSGSSSGGGSSGGSSGPTPNTNSGDNNNVSYG